MDYFTILYLIGSVTFILGLKCSNPATARKGNLAAAGMVVAILGTIFFIKMKKVKN